MKEIALVFLGGGSGSIARYLIGKTMLTFQPLFPFATLLSNFLSCLVFGAVLVLGMNRMNISDPLKLLLLTGFCGGFSTYSTFTFETVELFKNGNSGIAFTNIVINFVLSVAGLYLGASIARLS